MGHVEEEEKEKDDRRKMRRRTRRDEHFYSIYLFFHVISTDNTSMKIGNKFNYILELPTQTDKTKGNTKDRSQ